MKYHVFAVVLMIALAGVLAGCTRDPNVRKQKYLETGDKYLAKGQAQEAAIEYANAVKIDPNSAASHYKLAQAYLKMQVWGGAYAELTRTVNLQPDNLPAQLDLGNLLLGGGRHDEARKKAELVLGKDSRNADAHVLLANVAAAEGKNDEALQELQKAIEITPTKSDYYLNLAVLQANGKDLAAAEASAKKALALDPKSTTAHSYLGTLYWQQRRSAEAEQELRMAVDLDRSSLPSWLKLTNFYLSQEKRDDAEQTVQQAKQALADNPKGYSIAAEFSLNQGQPDKALAEFAALLKQHPRDLTLKKRYIEVLLQTKHIDEASRLTDEILKDNPKDVEGLIYRASLQLQEGKAAEAVTGLQSAVKSDAQNAFAHYMLGLALNAKGDRQQGESEIREAVHLRPNMLPALLALANIAGAKGDMDQLNDIAEAMIKNAPGWPEGYIRRAYVELRRKQLDKVDADLRKATQVAPRSAVGYIKLGEYRYGQKRFAEARQLFEQALQNDPGSVEALANLVGLDMDQKQPDKAEARVRAQIAAVPNVSAFYVMLGTLQTRAKDYAGAEASLKKAIELDPNNMVAFFTLGQVQLAAGSPDQAIKSWEDWMRQNPKDVRAYMMIASLEDSRGNWQKTQQMLQKALEIQPDYPLAANNLAYLMLQHGGNPDVALTLAQTARRQMPDSPNVADTLALAYYQKGLYASAIGLLEDAVKKQPDNATMHYHLGMAYEKTNQPALARQHLERALKLNPQLPDAASARKALAGIKG